MPFTQQLEQVIENVSPETLTTFFQAASDKFRPGRQDRNYDLAEDQDLLESLEQLGQIEFATDDTLIVLAGKITGDMTRRRSRSAQYAVARKIIKQDFNDAAIFVFYDDAGRFRFSLITALYSGRRREFSTFKRYTYFIAPDQPNGTFLRQIGLGGFDSVDSILQAFSVEAVSKEFYTEIAKLFTDLIGGERKIGSKTYKGDSTLKFPNHDDTKRKEFAVRLIGRLVFCWFLKKKTSEAGVPLVPEEILSSAALAGTQRYYHNVLEPLFFETLNKEKALRHKNFRDKYWDTIPFLNGGLFESQPADFYEFDDVTGQSAQYANMLNVPDQWLTRLLEVFDRYNFTIDESSPLDIEVAVDPEILGRIFENLLAEINPATGKTARKSTGSYYTPRQIVEYMVHESVKKYLLSCTNVPEDKINSLLSYDYSDNPLTSEQTETVIDRLHKIKILDPACGSGAFPMGILQKIILALEKLDPDGARWKERILGEISDPTYRNALKNKLDNETWQYIHKLGVIRTSIYGVDIQPIAVEIAKLRAFLSLVVDETVNDRRKNRGIEPLPNLEFKFVCANTLIDLPEAKIAKAKKRGKKVIEIEGQTQMFEATDDIAEIRQVVAEYFTSYGEEKRELEQKFRDIQSKLRQHTLDWGKTDTQTAKLADWDPFGHDSCSWFSTEWMFGVTEGFDIVIGNPPYVRVHKQDAAQKQALKQLYKSPFGDFDIYIVFIEKSLLILRSHGFLSFITPDKFLIREYGQEIRKIILNNRIVEFYDISRADDAFGAAVYPLISMIQKAQTPSQTRVRFGKSVKNINSPQSEYLYPQSDWRKSNRIELVEGSDLKILNKITNGSKTLSNLIGNDAIFCGTPRARDYYEWSKGLVEKKTAKTPRVLVCSNLTPYCIDHGKEVRTLGERIKGPYFNNSSKLIGKNQWSSFLHVPKILIRGNDTRITAVLDEEPSVFIGIYGIKLTHSTTRIAKFMTAALNSSLYQWVFLTKNHSLKIGGDFFSINAPQLLALPFRQPSENTLNLINRAFDQILAAKRRDPKADTTALERKIDRMVYALYSLTEEEIAVVENSKD